jgi:hypothetical protein
MLVKMNGGTGGGGGGSGPSGTGGGSPSAGNIQGALHTNRYLGDDSGTSRKKKKKRKLIKAEPTTLYVNRPIVNGRQIVDWAKSVGFRTTLPEDDLHVTIAFSRTPLDWDALEPSDVEQIVISNTQQREIATFGEGATVLKFRSLELNRRWNEFKHQGASWDWPDYKPHITLSYSAPPRAENIAPYRGPIILGPEEWSEVKDDWKDNVVEKAGPKKDKDEVEYQWSPSGDERCGRCSMFRAPRDCTDVEGDISPDGWCNIFDRHKSSRTDEEVGGYQFNKSRWSDDIMEKVGARHSRGDMEMLQNIHDHSVKLGAACNGHDDKKDVEKFRIAKVDESLGLVFGYAMVCKANGQDYYDLNRDPDGKMIPEHIPEATMLKSAADFMQNSRMGNDMHNGPNVGTYVFAFPLTTDIAKSLGIEPTMTGLLVGFKPSPELFAKFKSGAYKGFSIEGRRVAIQEVDEP